MKVYQKDYASNRPQMYDEFSRRQKGKRVIALLRDYYGEDKLKNLIVLDIGSSTGIIDDTMADSFRKLVGIDIDEKAVKFANRKFKRRNLLFKVDDSMKLSFKDNCFDVIVCMQVYEHVPDAKKLFSEIERVLKPGGVCYLAAINKFWPWEPHYNLPFLSWLPKPLANVYVRLTRKANIYYETPLSYWQLKDMLKNFKIIEYTSKIVANTNRFLYPSVPYNLGRLISIPAKYFSSSFIWLLVKRK